MKLLQQVPAFGAAVERLVEASRVEQDEAVELGEATGEANPPTSPNRNASSPPTSLLPTVSVVVDRRAHGADTNRSM